MRVIAYPADQGGCGFYRLIAPCRAHGDEVAGMTPQMDWLDAEMTMGELRRRLS